MLPLRSMSGARTSTVPEIPEVEEVLTRLRGSARKTPATMLILPPFPSKAWAMIWPWSRMSESGDSAILPPVVSSPPPTLAVSRLPTSYIREVS